LYLSQNIIVCLNSSPGILLLKREGGN